MYPMGLDENTSSASEAVGPGCAAPPWTEPSSFPRKLVLSCLSLFSASVLPCLSACRSSWLRRSATPSARHLHPRRSATAHVEHAAMADTLPPHCTIAHCQGGEVTARIMRRLLGGKKQKRRKEFLKYTAFWFCLA